MRMRKKPNLTSRMEKCAHLLVDEPGVFRGRWLSILPEHSQTVLPEPGYDEFKYGELHIEPGCGKGRFTVETAKAGSGILFAALEKSANAMVIALERAAAEGLQNVKFINALADNLTEYFAPDEVSRIYLNFCDPWPSNRHAKRRLTNRRFLELYLQVLRPGGEIHFKTDNLPLFEFSLKEFEYCGFEALEISRNLHKYGPAGVMTDYELKFYSQGLPIFKCVTRKR